MAVRRFHYMESQLSLRWQGKYLPYSEARVSNRSASGVLSTVGGNQYLYRHCGRASVMVQVDV